MWELIDQFSQDPNYRIRLELISKLAELGRAHPDRALPLVRKMLKEAPSARGKAREVTKACISCLTEYYTWRADQTAENAINEIVQGLPQTAEDAGMVFPSLRNALKYVEPGNPERALKTRERAARLYNALISKAVPPMRQLIAKKLRREKLTDQEDQQFDALGDLLIVCGGELYFASGAFQEHRYELPPIITSPEQTELYHALAPSWDLLAEIGAPKLVHSLVQTLEMFIPVDPERVFLRIGNAVLAGKLWRYQFESQAVDLIVRVIRTYIAEHRSIFQKSPECLRVLREILDLFITAGWPSARSLSYRVDEVFR